MENVGYVFWNILNNISVPRLCTHLRLKRLPLFGRLLRPGICVLWLNSEGACLMEETEMTDVVTNLSTETIFGYNQ